MFPPQFPGGDETTGTWVSILERSGRQRSFGLIQGGIDIKLSQNVMPLPAPASFATVFSREHADGQFSLYWQFRPSPGDQIYTQEWYCDAYGT